MKAMIFAAGLGTRLKPITDTMPKAMVPVGGKPLLYHIVCKLRDAGYDEIVVNVHHFAKQIRDYLQENDFGVRIRVSDESSRLLETGGGILAAKDLLLPSCKPFLVHNVDILSNLDLSSLRGATRDEDLATLVVSPRETRRYLLFSEDMRLVGWTDTSTGEVRSPYPGLDPSSCQRYAFSGIHNVSPAIFDAMDSLGFAGRFSIIDFYLKACAGYSLRGYVPESLSILDVGKIDTLREAERYCETSIK